MKFLFVFFVCYLSVALANPTEDEDRTRALKLCREEMKLSDKDLEDPSKLGCFYSCVHKKEGYVFADGRLNVAKATHGSRWDVLVEKVQKVHRECVEASKGDSCKASLCLEKART